VVKRIGLSKKMALGFGVILVILAGVGGVSDYALNRATGGFSDYRNMARERNSVGRVRAGMLDTRLAVRGFLANGKQSNVEDYEKAISDSHDQIDEAKERSSSNERRASLEQLTQIMKEYDSAFKEVVQLRRERDGVVEQQLAPQGKLLEDNLTVLVEQLKATNGTASALAADGRRHILRARLAVMKYLASSEPSYHKSAAEELKEIDTALATLAGDANTAETAAAVGTAKEANAKYIAGLAVIVANVEKSDGLVANTLDRIGAQVGTMTRELDQAVKGEQDVLGPRVQNDNQRAVAIVIGSSIAAIVLGIVIAFVLTRSIVRPVRQIIKGLNEGATQVNEAANQVSMAAQSLAEGASEQAASLEETSAAVEEVSEQTRSNAGNSHNASERSGQTQGQVSASQETMARLNNAMEAINASSDKISKIIKVIEGIAFQTNLLALNAAVEAARAGEHGKGFAVVAQEVRSLAQRAATAAKDTTELIEDSVRRARDGVSAAEEVGKNLGFIVGGVTEVTTLIDGIAKASEEQAQGVDQVNTAVAQMDKVTQQNAAAAEECASASEELSAQSVTVRGMVDDLVRLVEGGQRDDGANVPVEPVRKKSLSRLSGAGAKKVEAPVSSGLSEF